MHFIWKIILNTKKRLATYLSSRKFYIINNLGNWLCKMDWLHWLFFLMYNGVRRGKNNVLSSEIYWQYKMMKRVSHEWNGWYTGKMINLGSGQSSSVFRQLPQAFVSLYTCEVSPTLIFVMTWADSLQWQQKTAADKQRPPRMIRSWTGVAGQRSIQAASATFPFFCGSFSKMWFEVGLSGANKGPADGQMEELRRKSSVSTGTFTNLHKDN